MENFLPLFTCSAIGMVIGYLIGDKNNSERFVELRDSYIKFSEEYFKLLDLIKKHDLMNEAADIMDEQNKLWRGK